MDIQTVKIFKDYTELYESERHELRKTIEQFENTNIFLRKIFVDRIESASENILPTDKAFAQDGGHK